MFCSIYRYCSVWRNISALCCSAHVLGGTCRKYPFYGISQRRSNAKTTWNWECYNEPLFLCVKAINVTYCDFVFVSLIIQHVRRMRRIVEPVTCTGLSYFSLLTHKGYEFRKTAFTRYMCVWFFLQILSQKFPFFRKTERDVTIYIYTYIHRVSQGERTKLRESVSYVKLYRYNPKHPYPKLNGYGDNGQRKVWTSCISASCTSTAVSRIDRDRGMRYAFLWRHKLRPTR